MVKLSVCVPIYGVEKEIPRFLSSLEQNLHPDMEVLLVDDGSKDNSGRIADDFAAKHPDIVRVFHKPNGGVSSARNKALEMARGEYVIFPDPDDYLADDYVQTILEAIDRYDSPDMIFFDFYKGRSPKKLKVNRVPDFQEGVISKEAFIRELIKDKAIRGYLCCKAIKRSFFERQRFDVQVNVGEDYAILTDMVLEMETFVYLPRPLYYYIVRPTGLTKSGLMADSLKFHELVLDRYRKHAQLYDGLNKCSLINSSNGLLKWIYTEGGMDAEPLERIVKDNIKDILLSHDFTLEEKKRSLFVWLGVAESYYRRKQKSKKNMKG